jgi:membrane peptidoglycan carboxypeptidase
MPLVIVGFGTLSVAATLAFTGLVWGLIWFGGFAGALPSVDELTARTVFQTLPVYANDGTTRLYEITDPNGGRRTVIPLSDMSRNLIEATIATEDAGFFSNPGFELRSILRAGIEDLTHQQILSGASTITQQVVRNVLLTPADRNDLSARRKIKEIVVAYQVTQTYSKDDILDIYLNEIYYGNHNYGIEAAAEGYFGESAANLDLAQASLLAGIPQAPGLYDPYLRLDEVKARQEVVLDRMVEQGYITADEASQADAEDVRLVNGKRADIAPHFVAYVADQVTNKVGSDRLYTGGDQVITTLDSAMQSIFDNAVRQDFDAIGHDNGTNLAAIALDPNSGAILAMVGSANYDDPSIAGEVNMAFSPRQSGGILTPATFALALGHGLTLVSPVEDTSVSPPIGAANSDPALGRAQAPVLTMGDALARGLAQPAASIMRLVGNQSLIDLANATGLDNFASRLDYGADLTIAGARVSALDVAQVYAMFARGGVAHPPAAISRILDRSGNVLDASTSPDREVLDPGVAFLISSVLADTPLTTVDGQPVVDPNTRLAAHSGISEDRRDAWVAGYDPNLVVVVWVGSGGTKPLTSADPAVRLWGDVMRPALKLRPPDPFVAPPDVVALSLCKNAGCSARQTEYAMRGTEAIVEAANAAAIAASARIKPDSRTPLVGRDQSVGLPASPVVAALLPAKTTTLPVTIPDVTGSSLDLGRERLLAAGLQVAANPKYVSGAQLPRGSQAQVGQIVSTSPTAGAQVSAGTQITIVIRTN